MASSLYDLAASVKPRVVDPVLRPPGRVESAWVGWVILVCSLKGAGPQLTEHRGELPTVLAALNCTSPLCTAPHCTAPLCTAPLCNVLHLIVLYGATVHGSGPREQQCILSWCVISPCTAHCGGAGPLHCALVKILHCTVHWWRYYTLHPPV